MVDTEIDINLDLDALFSLNYEPILSVRAVMDESKLKFSIPSCR